MKRYLHSAVLMVVTMFSMGLTCNAQNGPTPPQAVASWTQAVPTPTSGAVTGNSVYRCSPSPCVPAPPAISTSATPITSYTDNSIVAGTTYVYAVTAHFGAVEGPYSNDSAPYSWAFSAPTFGTITGSLVPQAQAKELPVVAKSVVPLTHCTECSTVSSLMVRRVK